MRSSPRVHHRHHHHDAPEKGHPALLDAGADARLRARAAAIVGPAFTMRFVAGAGGPRHSRELVENRSSTRGAIEEMPEGAYRGRPMPWASPRAGHLLATSSPCACIGATSRALITDGVIRDKAGVARLQAARCGARAWAAPASVNGAHLSWAGRSRSAAAAAPSSRVTSLSPMTTAPW